MRPTTASSLAHRVRRNNGLGDDREIRGNVTKVVRDQIRQALAVGTAHSGHSRRVTKGAGASVWRGGEAIHAMVDGGIGHVRGVSAVHGQIRWRHVRSGSEPVYLECQGEFPIAGAPVPRHVLLLLLLMERTDIRRKRAVLFPSDTRGLSVQILHIRCRRRVHRLGCVRVDYVPLCGREAESVS
jgi:hypothetical protein